jgi:hypothetical protein
MPTLSMIIVYGHLDLCQMKAVAEATINELKSRISDRDKALAELQALLEATKAQWLAQHQTDREEIARLNQALFERNNASIDNLKVEEGGGHKIGSVR